MKTISAPVDYVDGHLRYGHMEAKVTEEVAAEVSAMTEQEQKEWLQDNGTLVVDDYRVNDYGDLGSVSIS